MNDREVLRRIKVLRKLKRTLVDKDGKAQRCPARNELNAKIRTLKKELNKGLEITPEKTTIIEEIYKYKPYLKTLRHFNLYKYTVEQLTFHLKKVKEKRRIK